MTGEIQPHWPSPRGDLLKNNDCMRVKWLMRAGWQPVVRSYIWTLIWLTRRGGGGERMRTCHFNNKFLCYSEKKVWLKGMRGTIIIQRVQDVQPKVKFLYSLDIFPLAAPPPEPLEEYTLIINAAVHLIHLLLFSAEKVLLCKVLGANVQNNCWRIESFIQTKSEMFQLEGT